MLKRTALPAIVFAFLTLISLIPWKGLRAQPEQKSSASLFDRSAHTLLIRYGVTDKVEKTWRGRLEPDSGNAQIVSVTGYHFQPPDRVTGREWEFKTRLWETSFQQV